MKKRIPIKKVLCYLLYAYFAKYLPRSVNRPFGKMSKKIRYLLCSRIFEYCGNNVNVERMADFGHGFKLQIGDNSGLGINCCVPDGSIIGKNVMMGPNCYIHSRNHAFGRTDIPMIKQGYSATKFVKIDDDVWIGRDVTIMVGRHISEGTIVAANTVVTKDFPPYSIIGGNPSRIIKSRLHE